MTASPTREVDLFFIVGLSPQIVPEVLFALAREGLSFRHLNLLTTKGEQTVRMLYGELVNADGSPGRRLVELWERFPATRLEGAIRIETTDSDDVRDPASVGNMGQRIDAELKVALRAAGDGRPVVACLSGGRKSMTAWLTLSMCLRGRPGDRLVHVLVDPSLENTRDPNVWPPRDEADGRLIALVDIPYPRLSSLQAVRTDKMIDAIVSDVTAQVESGSPRLRVDRREGLLALSWRGSPVRLAPLPSALLAFYAHRGGRVSWKTLPGDPDAIRLFEQLYDAAFTTRQGGDSADDILRLGQSEKVRRARISELHSELRGALRESAPSLLTALEIRPLRGDPRRTIEAGGMLDGRVQVDILTT